jgi:hypothetical protein
MEFMEEQILQVHKDLRPDFWKIGDFAEITDSGGGSYGKLGDQGVVVHINNYGSNNDVIQVKLQSGIVSSRYGWRYKKIHGEWDI